MNRKAVKRLGTGVLITAAILAAGFILREPVTCFFFMRNLPDQAILYRANDGVRIMSLDGAGRCPIAIGETYYTPAGSPDGRHVVYFDEGPSDMRGQLIVVDIQTGSQTPISGPDLGFDWLRNIPPTWSPDGERLVFSGISIQSGATGLYIWSRADGIQLIPDTENALKPIWSPDGRRIIYTTLALRTQDENTWQLHSIRPDGSEHRVLADDLLDGFARVFTSDLTTLTPIFWLPDGGMAYIRRTDYSGARALVLLAPETGERQREIILRRPSFSYRLSSDGTKLAMLEITSDEQAAEAELNYRVLVLDIGASSDDEVRVILQTNDMTLLQNDLQWSGDDSVLFYLNNSSQIQRLPISGGSAASLDVASYFTVWQRTQRE